MQGEKLPRHSSKFDSSWRYRWIVNCWVWIAKLIVLQNDQLTPQKKNPTKYPIIYLFFIMAIFDLFVKLCRQGTNIFITIVNITFRIECLDIITHVNYGVAQKFLSLWIHEAANYDHELLFTFIKQKAHNFWEARD